MTNRKGKLPPGISKVSGAKPYRVAALDSANKRHRRKFATEDEARDYLDSIKRQKATGEFFATASNTKFNHALDLLLTREKKVELETARRIKSVVEGHIRPALGERKLNEFAGERMEFVKAFLKEKATDNATAYIAHMHSNIKLALDLAIAAGVMGAPNPMLTFKVGVPPGTETRDREVLTLDEITALVRGSMKRGEWRAGGEQEHAFVMRRVLVMLGLLTGFRNQECSGLFWDCVDFEGRTIYMRRVWRKGVGIVRCSKTGKDGFRDIHMSPVLHAVLSEYADRLRELGRTIEGPVLSSARADIVRPLAIEASHWPTLAAKAGFVDEAGALKHTFYALRHTAGNLWRTVGFDLSYVKDYMGHKDIATTSENYLHRTPHFAVLRREVEDLGMSGGPEGLVDALGIVLAQRWRDEGLDISCSLPAERSLPARLRHELGEQQARLTSNVVELQPDAVSINGTDAGPAFNGVPSLQALREWQRPEAKRLAGLGWKYSRIAARIGVDRTTVSNMVRAGEEQIWLRKVGHAERRRLRDEAIRMRVEQDATNTEIGRALNIDPTRIALWLRGYPMKQWRRASQKYDQHEPLIRQRLAEGKTPSAIAREIGDKKSTGVIAFAERRGLYKTTPRARKSRVGTG